MYTEAPGFRPGPAGNICQVLPTAGSRRCSTSCIRNWCMTAALLLPPEALCTSCILGMFGPHTRAFQSVLFLLNFNTILASERMSEGLADSDCLSD